MRIPTFSMVAVFSAIATTSFVVWRDAETGDELARTQQLPAMTSGTMIQPYYFGKMFYPSLDGSLIELTVQPAPG